MSEQEEQKKEYKIEVEVEDDTPAVTEASYAIDEIVSCEVAPDNSANEEVSSGANAAKENGLVTIPACFTAKNYHKDYAYIALLAVLSIGGALFGTFVESYRLAGIIIAILSLVAAVALVSHIIECKKVAKLVYGGECTTVTELMQKLHKARKPEFVRTIGGMIRDGHLVGYQVLDDEKLVKRIPEEKAE